MTLRDVLFKDRGLFIPGTDPESIRARREAKAAAKRNGKAAAGEPAITASEDALEALIEERIIDGLGISERKKKKVRPAILDAAHYCAKEMRRTGTEDIGVSEKSIEQMTQLHAAVGRLFNGEQSVTLFDNIVSVTAAYIQEEKNKEPSSAVDKPEAVASETAGSAHSVNGAAPASKAVRDSIGKLGRFSSQKIGDADIAAAMEGIDQIIARLQPESGQPLSDDQKTRIRLAAEQLVKAEVDVIGKNNGDPYDADADKAVLLRDHCLIALDDALTEAGIGEIQMLTATTDIQRAIRAPMGRDLPK